ncbi:MAG: hypothetical protein JWO06_3405 [Bacteroidota bacterium]|nr:hypothetical protein [Bacteroidota bacterium]
MAEEKKSRYRNALLFIGVTAITLLLSEFVLRAFFGIVPGIHTYSEYFRYVDSLVELKGLYADTNGILKVSPDIAREIELNVNKGLTGAAIVNNDDTHLTEVTDIYKDFVQLNDPTFKNALSEMIRELKKKPGLSSLDSLVLQYSRKPINDDGFRSISFAPVSTKKKKVLLLGDSFVWGHSADNKTSSFADILLARGYVVYNTGISGTDPTQYLAVAKKYIPILKPDFVVVNFFMGNDVMNFRREALPGVPVYYSTNAGRLFTCPEGLYLGTPQQVYQFNLDRYRIPNEKNGFNSFCSKSALGTVLWMAAYKLKLKCADAMPEKYGDYGQKIAKIQTEKPYSDTQIDSIQTISKQNDAKFILVTIPVFYNNKLHGVESMPHLFYSLKYYPSPVPLKNYDLKGGHFNEVGHMQYALFLDSLIKAM